MPIRRALEIMYVNAAYNDFLDEIEEEELEELEEEEQDLRNEIKRKHYENESLTYEEESYLENLDPDDDIFEED